jgi:RNA polymerase sigma factor (sigma-70 family)
MGMISEPVSVAPALPVAGDACPGIATAYARRGRQLWSYARRLGLDSEAAEDAMQEAFARAAGLPAGSVEELDAWLFRVVHNLAMDAHRRAARRDVVREIPTETAGTDVDERLVLWQSVDRLPERQRAVVYLRYRADLPYAAIASILGITEGGARANGARGLDQLREWMDRR